MSTQAKRPRIWVPRIAWVSDERELDVGTHAGFNGYGDAFSAAPVGHFVPLVEWRHCVWIIERRAITRALVEEHAIILAEELLDPDALPYARRWLAEQPLICVSGQKARRLMDAGLRVYRIEHGVEGDDVLCLEASGGGRSSWRLRGPVSALMPESDREQAGSLVRAAAAGHRSFVDRLLDSLTVGVVRETAAVNAMMVRKLIEPGYGYRGATDGEAAGVDAIGRALEPLDEVFAQIYERAQGQRKDARAIERAVTRAPDDVDEVEVPVYGRAMRRRLAEVTLALDEGCEYVAGGQQRDELTLPQWSVWYVERIEMWWPDPPRARSEPDKGSDVVARPWMALVLALVLVGIVVVGMWLEP